MTIYYTPFDPETMEWTAPSQVMDAFQSIDQVVEMMGPPIKRRGNFVIYPGSAYTVFPCRIDGEVTQPVTLHKNTGSSANETQA